MDIQAFNQEIIDAFRANGGRVGGQFEGVPLLLLLLLGTTGARSGAARVNPLACFDDGERLLVIASYAGADRGRGQPPAVVPQPGGEPGCQGRGRQRLSCRARRGAGRTGTHPGVHPPGGRRAGVCGLPGKDRQEKTARKRPNG